MCLSMRLQKDDQLNIIIAIFNIVLGECPFEEYYCNAVGNSGADQYGE